MRRPPPGISLALSAALAAATLLPLLAAAHHVRVRDQNDVRGPLDVETVDLEGTERRPRWRVQTYRDWRTRDIWDAGFVFVYLDTLGGDRFDYYALARSNGSQMVASLWRDRRNKPAHKLAALRVRRPNRRTVAIRIPLKKVRMGDRRLHYGWQVQTLFSGSRCRRVCFDFAPERNPVMEPVPGTVPPSPTPTLSSTPTITPTPTP